MTLSFFFQLIFFFHRKFHDHCTLFLCIPRPFPFSFPKLFSPIYPFLFTPLLFAYKFGNTQFFFPESTIFLYNTSPLPCLPSLSLSLFSLPLSFFFFSPLFSLLFSFFSSSLFLFFFSFSFQFYDFLTTRALDHLIFGVSLS